MTETQNVELVDGGSWKYQQQHGLSRKFPMNGVPVVQKRDLTTEEKAILSAPIIKNASKEAKHSAGR